MSEQPDLRTLRARVADCEMNLAHATWADKVERARAERRGIDAAGDAGDGKNESERERALTLWLANDDSYQIARRWVIEAQYDLRMAQAELEVHVEIKRDERVRATEKLADALLAGWLMAEVIS